MKRKNQCIWHRSRMNIFLDYNAQLRDEMVRVLPTRGKREKDAFAALDIREQAWRFLNWQSRLVHPHPREINIAEDFDGLPDVQANRILVDALLASLARGDDVTGHLSRDVTQGYCCSRRPGRKGGPDFDLLLNEWGIHHFHLKQASGNGGFKERSNQLLYAIIGRGVAFVLAVAPHGAWTSRRFIETTIRSWPNQGLFVALPGILPGRDWTEDEHKGLRKAGVTTLANVDDRCWISGVTGGITSALVSLRVSREADQLLRCVDQATREPERVERQLRYLAAQRAVSWPRAPAISIRRLYGLDRFCFGFFEEKSRTALLIETDPRRVSG